MAPTSDDSPADTNIDMIIEEAPSTPSRSRASNATNPVEQHSLSLKFEFRVENEDFAVRDVHREIMFAIANKCSGTIFRHNNADNNNPFDPFIDSDESMDKNYNYKFLKRSNHFLACFSHSIETHDTFNEVKSHFRQILSKNNGYVRINKWNEHDLDIATAGWLFEANPHVHNRDYIHKTIQTYCRSLDVTYHHVEITNKTISFTNRNTKTKSSTQAIHFLCRREELKQVQHMLQTLYSNETFNGPGKFIPIDIAMKQNTMALEKLIQLQQVYLNNHRSIPMLGVSFESLVQLINNKENSTLEKLIIKCEWIDWVTPTTKTESTGRIIFSTTSQHYFSAIEWVENIFLPYHKSIHHRINPTDFKGEAYRIVRKEQLNKVNDDYTSTLMKTINAIPSSAPTTNAWNKPLVIGQGQSSPPMTNKTIPTNNQQSTSNQNEFLQQQITTLSQTMEKLQEQIEKQIQQQLQLTSTIETIVQSQISKRFEEVHTNIQTIENKYIAIIDHINESWSTKLDRMRKSHSTVTNSSSTEAPGSGSNRARKQPRTTPDLTDVQRNLFLDPIPPQNDTTDSTTQDESFV